MLISSVQNRGARIRYRLGEAHKSQIRRVELEEFGGLGIILI